MTFCKTLAKASNGKITIIAYGNTEKYSCSTDYEIVIDRGTGIVQNCDIYHAARTTWRKKFNQLVKDLL